MEIHVKICLMFFFSPFQLLITILLYTLILFFSMWKLEAE